MASGPAGLLLGAALVYAVITFFVYAPLSGAGDPIVKDGSFFFNDHGVIREVSEAQFHAERKPPRQRHEGKELAQANSRPWRPRVGRQ
jgi:hypothetical protein